MYPFENYFTWYMWKEEMFCLKKREEKQSFAHSLFSSYWASPRGTLRLQNIPFKTFTVGKVFLVFQQSLSRQLLWFCVCTCAWMLTHVARLKSSVPQSLFPKTLSLKFILLFQRWTFWVKSQKSPRRVTICET